MNSANLVRYTSDALYLCLMISLPTIITAALSGLLIAFLQAVFSLQDASISFALKLIIVVFVLLLTAPRSASMLMQFSKTLMEVAFP